MRSLFVEIHLGISALAWGSVRLDEKKVHGRAVIVELGPCATVVLVATRSNFLRNGGSVYGKIGVAISGGGTARPLGAGGGFFRNAVASATLSRAIRRPGGYYGTTNLRRSVNGTRGVRPGEAILPSPTHDPLCEVPRWEEGYRGMTHDGRHLLKEVITQVSAARMTSSA